MMESITSFLNRNKVYLMGERKLVPTQGVGYFIRTTQFLKGVL